jgi:glycosyltransferase involved in cell wall biosynthesis
MKSVLLFTGIYPPDIGGPATFIPQMEDFFFSEGRSFQTITLADGFPSPDRRRKNLTLIARNLPKLIRITRVVFQGWKYARKFDVIFSNGLYEEAAILSVLTGKPLISKVVGIPVWEVQQRTHPYRSNLLGGLENLTINSLPLLLRLRNAIWEKSLQKSHLVITPSFELERYLKSRSLTVPVKVIENGTDVGEFMDEAERYDVVTTVRLVPWKNIDVLIAAVKKFNFSLAIVGDGPERKALEIMAKDDHRIHFLGVLDRESVSKVLMASKVFTLVSSYEGLSYSLIEALAHGKACVLSRSAGNLDAMRDSSAAAFVGVRDIDETGQAIRRLLDDNSLRLLKERAAKEFALMHFDRNTQLEKVVKEIDEV